MAQESTVIVIRPLHSPLKISIEINGMKIRPDNVAIKKAKLRILAVIMPVATASVISGLIFSLKGS